MELAARVQEGLGNRRLWHRRIWNVGTLMCIREFVQGIESHDGSAVGNDALDRMQRALLPAIGPDPGLGDTARRRALTKVLKAERTIAFGSAGYHALKSAITDMESNYLIRWGNHLRQPGDINVEVNARYLASHLLDMEFGGNWLRAWLDALLLPANPIPLPDVLDQAHAEVSRGVRPFDVVICFTRYPKPAANPPVAWRTGTQISAWLRNNHFDTRGLRIGSGIQTTINARDIETTVKRATELALKVAARASIGDCRDLLIVEKVWIAGEVGPLVFARESRGVEVHYLGRQDHIFRLDLLPSLDNAIELLGVLESGTPGAAAASAWAALESILKGPGEGALEVVDQASAIAAAALPRAELTHLAHQHERTGGDALAAQLGAATTNTAKAKILLDHLRRGGNILTSSLADQLATRRLCAMFIDPEASLSHVREQVRSSLNRLYRLRNLVVHAAKTDAVSIRAGTRVVAPLIGAITDRIIDAHFAKQWSPLMLAAKANLSLQLVGSPETPPLDELLT